MKAKKMKVTLVKRLLILAVVVMTAQVASADPWWDSDWQYRKQITIDYTKVDSDLSSFPVLISLDADANLAARAQSDGNDIAFADDSGTKIPHEIELYDNSTGRLVAWAKIPLLSSTTDTVIYMYYANSGAANQEDAAGLWDSNYNLVQHLQETSGPHYDSTSNNNDGTTSGGVTQNTVGQIAGADSFDGVDGYVDLGNQASVNLGTSDFTVQAWFKTSNSTWHYILSKGGGTGTDEEGYGIALTGGKPYGFINDGARLVWTTGTGAYADNAWHHFVAVYDRDGSVTPYVDGTALPATSLSGYSASVSGIPILELGRYSVASKYWTGGIDEVRLSTSTLSESWIVAEYRNQSSPGTF